MGLLGNLANAPAESGVGNALMAAAAALLTPQSRGGGMGAAFNAMPQMLQQARMQALQERLYGMKGKALELDISESERKRMSDEQMAANRAAFLQSMQQRGFKPDMAAEGLAAGFKPDELAKMAGADRWGLPELKNVGGVGVDPHTWQPVGAVNDPNQPFGQQMTPNGELRTVANAPFQSFKTNVARAGAPSVSVKVNNEMGKSIAEQIGPMLKSSRTATEGSLKLAGAAERIIEAVDSGKVFTGPGATLRLRGAQLASMLGIGGKDMAEQITKTREVIRGLAESSLEARKELSGQGQVTENEAAAVQKAMSGDIDDLTGEEIKLIAGLNMRAARLKAKQHQHMLDSIPQEMGTARPFYEIPGMENFTAEPAPAAGPNIDDLIQKYGQ